jgi:hypothetical protein
MSTIARVTNFVDGDVLDAADLNDEFDNLVDNLNALNNDNIAAAAGIAPSKISASIAGSGLVKNGTTGALEVNPDNVTVEISSNQIVIKDLGITAAKLAADAVTTAKILDSNVTRAKLAALGQQQTGRISDSETGSSYADLTGLTVTITTTGRPVMVMLQGATSGATGLAHGSTTLDAVETAVRILRDATVVAEYEMETALTVSGATISVDSVVIPASSIFVIDTPAAGTYTYKLQGKNVAGDALSVSAELIAWELM